MNECVINNMKDECDMKENNMNECVINDMNDGCDIKKII